MKEDLTIGEQYITMHYPDRGKDASIRLRIPNWFQRQIWKYLLGMPIVFEKSK